MPRITAFAAIALLIAGCTNTSPVTRSGLSPQNFDTIIDGKPVALYTLVNHNGLEACITNYGGRVVSLMVPGADSLMHDVLLGHDNIRDYIDIDGNFGALIGRYGNRIAHGTFTLDSTTYRLPLNNFGHCLHGGPVGFHHAVWDVSQISDSSLCLTLNSPDGDAGFPGNISVNVTYTLTSDNALAIGYEATTDRPTILNLTNHAYFNLSGDPSRDILGEELRISASGYTPIDSTFIPAGIIDSVAGTPFDFRLPHPIGDRIDADNTQLRFGRGYDHNFVLDSAYIGPAAQLYDRSTGIIMDVYTDQPGIQIYTGNFLDGNVKGKHGIAYPRRSAICLETQHYPDSPNKPQWPSVRLDPDSIYHTATVYRFSAGKD